MYQSGKPSTSIIINNDDHHTGQLVLAATSSQDMTISFDQSLTDQVPLLMVHSTFKLGKITIYDQLSKKIMSDNRITAINFQI